MCILEFPFNSGDSFCIHFCQCGVVFCGCLVFDPSQIRFFQILKGFANVCFSTRFKQMKSHDKLPIEMRPNDCKSKLIPKAFSSTESS